MKAKSLLALAGISLFCAYHLRSAEVNVISPSPQGSLDPHGTTMPFLIWPQSRTLRYQQIYGASDFASIPFGGYITAITVALADSSGPCCSAQFLNAEIGFSTTEKGPDSLSSVFTENIGRDHLTVFGPGLLPIEGGGGGFSILIRFATPFFYAPSVGNLLLDVKIFAGALGPVFPNREGALLQQVRITDTISRVSAFDVNATFGELSTAGLITLFRVTPVPELSISHVSSNLVFRWPLPPVKFTLQKSATLGSGAWWQPTGGIVTTNRASNGNYDVQVILPIDPAAPPRFFRLTSQSSLSGSAETQTTGGLK